MLFPVVTDIALAVTAVCSSSAGTVDAVPFTVVTSVPVVNASAAISTLTVPSAAAAVVNVNVALFPLTSTLSGFVANPVEPGVTVNLVASFNESTNVPSPSIVNVIVLFPVVTDIALAVTSA